MDKSLVKPDEIKHKLRFDYLNAQHSPDHRIMEALQGILLAAQRPGLNLHAFLQEVANQMARLFWLRTVTIGLRSPVDGLYRYEVMHGLREDAWANHKKAAYKRDEFFDAGPYKGTTISKYTRIYLAEDDPYAADEKDAFNRPVMLKAKRHAMDESVEGDYFDFHILGAEGDLVGWVEVMSTKDGKILDATTIKWIETFASVLGVVIQQQRR